MAGMKQFAPEKIWASVNGQSTQLPSGRRQFVGGRSQDGDRPSVTEYVRALSPTPGNDTNLVPAHKTYGYCGLAGKP